ncbi:MULTISPECIES: plastocyanin [Aerosakkonema]|uniref:plastocyanin n=1 Tax=Aerosakkonema TaxID=1246629 RepID=UPI0035B79DAA
MDFVAAIARRLKLAFLSILLVACTFVLLTPPAAADTYTVKMGKDNGMLAFDPPKVTIKAGDTIEWLNNKLPPHNIVFDAAKNPAKSADLAKSLSHKGLLMRPGEKFQVTFPADAPAGVYTYYCEPHRGAGMVGAITVED